MIAIGQAQWGKNLRLKRFAWLAKLTPSFWGPQMLSDLWKLHGYSGALTLAPTQAISLLSLQVHLQDHCVWPMRYQRMGIMKDDQWWFCPLKTGKSDREKPLAARLVSESLARFFFMKKKKKLSARERKKEAKERKKQREKRKREWVSESSFVLVHSPNACNDHDWAGARDSSRNEM